MNQPTASGADLFRVAFDLAPAGMLAVDAAGRILLANREAGRLLGFEAGELVGCAVDEFVPAGFRGGHPGRRAEFFARPSQRAMGAGRDLTARRRDGGEVPVEIGLNPVRTGSGVVVIATIVDITARREAERLGREAEERQRQAHKLESLGTLAGGIAHDFNNLLLAITGYAELAGRASADRPAVHADLEQVLRAADRGRLLVQRILAFSRQREMARVPVRLTKVVEEGLALLRASLPSTIGIRSTLDERTPTVLADETQVQQVLLNLATNAAHAMKDGGTIAVDVAPADVNEALAGLHDGLSPGRYAHLVVSDHGAGMPPEVRERIFEPFFTTKPAGEGTGLGLSVILGIVRSFGGAVAIETEPGRGTRADVWLPAHHKPVETGERPADDGRPHEARHVLFVEDEEVLARLELRQLRSLGYRVTVHTSSLEALEDFRRRPHEFDLLVTDNTMPRMTGLELANEVTAVRPDLPVLMVSGYAENADGGTLKSHGVRATLRKPHTRQELGEAIAALFER